MSGGRYIKQAIIAALCEHPDQEKYKTRAFSGENLEKVMEALAEQRNKLTKEDFFTQDDEGKYLIDTPGFWRNFDKVLAIVNKAGDKFTMDDFKKPLGPNEDSRSLLARTADWARFSALRSGKAVSMKWNACGTTCRCRRAANCSATTGSSTPFSSAIF